MSLQSLANSMSASTVALGGPQDEELSQRVAEMIAAAHLRVRAIILAILVLVLLITVAVAVGLIVSGAGEEDKPLFQAGFFLLIVINGAILVTFYDIFVAQGLLETLRSLDDDRERFKAVKAIAGRKSSLLEFFASLLKKR